MMRHSLIAVLLLISCAVAAQERIAPAAGGQFQISGTVVNDSSNQPLANTHVTITAVQGGAAQTVMTGADGAFAFDHLRAGKYMLSAERRGFASQQYQQHEAQFSTAIVVGPGLETGKIVFRAQPDASFSGRVSDEQGEMVRSARVMLIREQITQGTARKVIVASTITNDQGFYHFAHLKPGAYYIAVSARPWYAEGPFMGRMGFGFRGARGAGAGGANTPANPALDVAYPLTFYPDVTDSAAARAITLRAGDQGSADFTLRTTQALHIRINNATSDGERQRFAAATLLQVIFDGIEVPLQTTSTGMDGRANLVSGIPPGRYVLRVNSNPRGFRRVESQAEDNEEEQPSRVREVELLSDTELDASEMPASAAVSGVVRLADGRPLPRPAQLLLRSRSLQVAQVARASDKGEFAFPRGMPAGSYEISMDAGEDAYIQRVSATGAKVTGRTVEIGSDAVHLSVIASSGMSRVEGVAMRDGKPQSGVMILLVPNDPANHLPLFRRDQSDSDGSFTLANVIPGRYTLLALEKGWDLTWSNPEVLKAFLVSGEKLVAQPKGTYKVNVNVD